MDKARIAAGWVFGQLWRWSVVAVGAPALYALGVGALFGDEYFIATAFFLIAILWMMIKVVLWEEAKAHETAGAIRILLIGVGSISFFLSCLWIWHRAASIGGTLGHDDPSKAARFLLIRFNSVLSITWVQNSAWIAFGMAFLSTLQRLVTILKTKLSRRAAGVGQEKGFLDYKLQVEEGIHRLNPTLNKITAIVGKVGPLLTMHTERLSNVVNSSARVQIHRVRKIARSLDYYSKQLDTKCADLEEIGLTIAEGNVGWLTWMSSQGNPSSIPLAFRNSMQELANTLETTNKHTNNYLEILAACHGVSKEMNEALENHQAQIRRIRDANEQIRKSCINGLLLLEPPLS